MPSLESIKLIDYLGRNVGDDYGVLSYFQDTLFNKFNPDINGFTLLFMVPPELSGLKINQTDPRHLKDTLTMYSPGGVNTALENVSKFVTFAAVDFTPPQEQLNTERISGRTGGIPYATEFTTSELCTATFIDDQNLSIYNFHQVWIYYIWDLVEGRLQPSDEYLDPKNDDVYQNGILYGALDYVASFYIVKYSPDLKTIKYIGKCIGAFPQALPSKELIGQRTSNELTTLPYQYFVSAYRSEIVTPNSKG